VNAENGTIDQRVFKEVKVEMDLCFTVCLLQFLQARHCTYQMHPAMIAGIANHVWTIKEMVGVL